MVHGGGGADGGVETALVEGPVGSINTDGERTVGLDSLHEVSLSLADSLVLSELVGSLGGIVGASASDSLVGVLSLSHHAVLDTVLHGNGHPATVAALVASDARGGDHAAVVAIDELLLREGRKNVVLEVVGSLHIGDDREGPAGTAGSLVLDTVDGALLSPVKVLIDTSGGDEGALGVDGDGVEVGSGELLLAHVSELVELEVGTTLRVEGSDELLVLSVVLEALDVVLGRVVDLAVLHGPLDELVVHVVTDGDGSEEKDSKDSLHFSTNN